MLCASWAGNISFISAKIDRLDERVLLSIQRRFWLFAFNRKMVF